MAVSQGGFAEGDLGFRPGTSQGIALALGATGRSAQADGPYLQKCHRRASNAWSWVDLDWAKKIERTIQVQIHQRFPDVEPELRDPCLEHLHHALFERPPFFQSPV